VTTEQREDFIGLTFMLVAAVLVGVAWFNWVQQRDSFLYSVMDCMQESSQEEYNYCAEQVNLGREVRNVSW